MNIREAGTFNIKKKKKKKKKKNNVYTHVLSSAFEYVYRSIYDVYRIIVTCLCLLTRLCSFITIHKLMKMQILCLSGFLSKPLE